MREIKFRAWYKPQNEMVDSKRLESINFEVKTIGAYIVKDGKGFNKFRTSDFELMQYTGLKDKNGVEIFEGDIVSARLASNKAGFTGYVHYLNAQYWVNYIGYESYYQALIYLHGAEYEPIEIIGNIYENPELSKEE